MSIRFVNVKKSFGPKKQILNGVSFDVHPGEILFILGQSGVGKSVTLKHIIGMLKPDSGDVSVNGEPIHQLGIEELSKVRRRCGMVFQQPALLDSLSVFDNIAFGLRTPQYIQSIGKPMSEKEIRETVEKNLKLVHLPENIQNKFPQEISYGMQKRVSLSRTLAPGPEVLLFDEPTTGLDPITTTAINDLIYELSRKLKVTSVVVSHDMACALKIADRILVLDKGKILEIGTTQQIRKSKKPLIRDFLSETIAVENEARR